jgi:hypothetical protein
MRARSFPIRSTQQDTLQIKEVYTTGGTCSRECRRIGTGHGSASTCGTRTALTLSKHRTLCSRSRSNSPSIDVPRLDMRAHNPAALAEEQQVPPREYEKCDIYNATEAEHGDHYGGDGEWRIGLFLPRGAEGAPSGNREWEDENGVPDRIPDHCHRLAGCSGEGAIEEGRGRVVLAVLRVRVQSDADAFPVLWVHLDIPAQPEEEEGIEENRRKRGGPEPEVFPRYSFGVESIADPAPVRSWPL